MIQKKRMKKLVACLLSLLLVAVCIPASAFASAVPDFNAPSVEVTENITIDKTINITGSSVIDLKGNTITYTGEAGTYLFECTGNMSKVTIKNGTIIAEKGRGIYSKGVAVTLEKITYVGAERAIGNYGSLTVVDKDTTLTTTGSDAVVFVRTENVARTNAAMLDFFGKAHQTAEKDGSFAISGNGSDLTGETKINIKAGAVVESKSAPGIYHPQNGAMTVDGTVTGTTGIEVRAGNVTVGENAIITATAPKYSAQPNGNGSTSEGAALAINQHTTQENITATVNGGTFKGAAALIVDGVQEASAMERAAGTVVANIKKGNFDGAVKVSNNGGEINVSSGKFNNLDRETVNVNATEIATITSGDETVDVIGLETINSVLKDMEANGIIDGATLTITKASKDAKFVVPGGMKVINDTDENVFVNDDSLEAGKEVELEKPETKPEQKPETKPEVKPEDKPEGNNANPQTSDETRMVSLIVLLMAASSTVFAVKRKNS